jgi:uroporphyrinogen III methyltransferase/synthase
VRWGTTSAQETVTGTLCDIAARAARVRLEPPVVIVIGDVVALRDRLQWFDDNRQIAVRAAGRRGAGAPPFEARFQIMEVAQ